MGFWDGLKAVGHQILPGGKTYSSYYADKKRKEDEERQSSWNQQQSSNNSAPQLRVSNAQPSQNIQVEQNQPEPEKPKNLFEDLNKGLVFNQPNNALDIIKSYQTKPPQKPKPGTVIQPKIKVENRASRQKIVLPKKKALTPEEQARKTLEAELDRGKSWEDIARDNNFDLAAVKKYSEATRPNYGVKIDKPNQGLGNKFRDIFDANTEADKFRRQESNALPGVEVPINYRNPVVDFGKRNLAPTGIFNIAKEIVQGTARAPIEIYQTLDKNLATIKENERMKDAGYTGEDREDIARQNAPSRTWNPTGWQSRIFGNQPVQPLQDSAEELSNLVQEKTGRKPSPSALAAMLFALNIVPGGVLGKGANKADDAAEGLLRNVDDVLNVPGAPPLRRPTSPIENLLTDADISDINTVQIPVTKNIPISGVEGLPENIGVRNLTEPKQLIKEFPGDANVATPNPLIQKFADDARAASVAENSFQQQRTVPKPDRSVDGVTPQSFEDVAGVTRKSLEEERTALNEALNNGDITRTQYRASNKSLDDILESAGKDFSRVDQASAARVKNKLITEYAAWLKEMGEGNGVNLIDDGFGGKTRVSNNVRFGDTKGKRMTKTAWYDEAERQLNAGQAEPGLQDAFNNIGKQTENIVKSEPKVDIGRKIQVKQVDGINVMDDTKVPQNLPENPGTVRATTTNAPSNVKSEAVAAQAPASLPKETQAILDNPKQYNKRQVAAARNQRKLARQVAKANEDTAEAMSRIETASPAAQSREGFVETGEFGKSVNKGSYQKASRQAEMAQAVQETANMSPEDVLQTARRNQGETGGFNRRDVRNVAALFEQKRIQRGTPLWNEARQILKEDGTIWGQTGALRNYTMRRNASTNELISRYESKLYKLAEDPTKIDSKLLDQVEEAEDLFVRTRDEATAAYNQFTKNPTSANAKAYHAAQDAAEKADVAAKQTEFEVANKALKGNKDIKQMRELEKMAQAADLYQMDAVDASMLSGTGTFVRNVVNASVGSVEEGLFGRPAAWISRKLTGQTVGGGVTGRGSITGLKKGAKNVVDASSARAKNAGKNPLEHIKNWSTTGNQLGDTVLDAQASKNTLNHYREMLRDQGYKGRELTDRASVMARQDPDNVGKIYSQVARTAAGLGQGITRNNRLETFMKNLISDTISGGKPGRVSEGVAKLATRMTIGFPTAIARSTGEGVKRFMLGAPTFFKAFKTADPQARAVLIKEGIKQAGTGGAVIPPLFYAMGAADLITGGYPDSKEERARWEREGISENSVKIGDAYYQLPAYLGAWAVPGLFYAGLGRNDGDWGKTAEETAKIIPDLLPIDNRFNDISDALEGRKDMASIMSQIGAGTVRATTPGGALLNQISKSFDSTKNDTTGDDELENFVNRVAGGLPGVNGGLVDIPDKLDDAGNPIQNPNAAELAFGAVSASQDKGIERSADIQAEVNDALQKMTDIGAIGDANLREILSDEDRLLYDKAGSGELTQGELEDVQEALVKGVSQEGTDTAYLEREQYDTHLAALQLKKQLMESDKTIKPSSLEKINTSIKRAEVYKDNEIPYDMISDYQDIGVEEWRKMGDPEEDEYDPDMYQKLWDIDQMMTKAGVSYKRGSLDKNKYYLKEKKSGSGSGSGQRKLGGDFGALKAGSFSPQIKAYETIDQQSGVIPVIRRTRSNIVHKISSSR